MLLGPLVTKTQCLSSAAEAAVARNFYYKVPEGFSELDPGDAKDGSGEFVGGKPSLAVYRCIMMHYYTPEN